MSEISWQIYLDAAERQVRIAELFHDLLLTALVDDPADWDKDRPQVKTQAYFEGLILAARSAEEKLYEAVCRKDGFSKKEKRKCYSYAQAVLKARALESEIKGSFEAAKNLRALRNVMTHDAHAKRPMPGGTWLVCPVYGEKTSYATLPLQEYAEQAHNLAKFLGQLIELYMQE